MQKPRSLAGRKPKYGENLDARVPIYFTQAQKVELEKKAGAGDISTFVRDVIFGAAANPQPVAVSIDPGLSLIRLHDIGSAPCGPLQEAIDAAQSFELSQDVANVLQATNGDWVVTAGGESMTGAGILEGMRVVMTPLAPRVDPPTNKITLVQIIVDGEVFLSTIKRWKRRLPNGKAELLDGEGESFPLPDNAEQVVAVATVKGVIGAVW